jgi:uncharacterized protein involved in exopolysaccharide biosynthesis
MVRYLETFFRHQLLFLIPIAVILAVSGAVVLRQPVVYTATTRLWVDRPALGTTDETASNPFTAPSADQVASMQELLNTRYFTVRVAHRGPLAAYLAAQPIAASGLGWVKAQLGGHGGARLPTADEVDGSSYDILSGGKNILVTPAGPQIVQIDFTFGDPKVASGTVTAVVDQFLEETLTSRKARSQVSERFYTGQLKTAQEALAAADGAVNQYLAQHPELRAINALPDARLVELQRADAQARDTMSNFQTKVDSAKLDQAALGAPGASGLRLLDAADVPAQASVSRRLLVQALAAGLGLGLVVVILGLLVVTLADTTVRRAEEVEQAFGLRLAGAVPLVVRAAGRKAAAAP